MDEKFSLRSTPFPLQTIFGDKVRNIGKGKGEGNCGFAKSERKVLRTVFKDPPNNINDKSKFAKTFMVYKQLGSTEIPKSDQYLSQEAVADSQGILHTVLHQPRASTMEKEIVIVNIEGILGNFHRREVSIRSETVQFLKELNCRYQVILVSGWKLARFLKLISYLSSKGIYISAAYKQVSHGSNTTEEFDLKRHDWYLDYSRIYKDFKINSANVKRVVVLAALMTHPDEINHPHFVVEYTGSLRPTFFVRKAPIPLLQFPFAPTTLLIPHMANLPLHLGPVPEALRQYFSSKSLSTFFNSQISYFTSNVLHKELLYLYHKQKPMNANFQSFLLLKSGFFSEIFLLHKENYIQRLNCENLLEFTLSMNY